MDWELEELIKSSVVSFEVTEEKAGQGVGLEMMEPLVMDG